MHTKDKDNLLTQRTAQFPQMFLLYQLTSLHLTQKVFPKEHNIAAKGYFTKQNKNTFKSKVLQLNFPPLNTSVSRKSSMCQLGSIHVHA